MQDYFTEEILALDYEKMRNNILKYGEEDKKYYDAQPALEALSGYMYGEIDFAALTDAINETFANRDVRETYDADKDCNIIDRLKGISEADIGKNSNGEITFTANASIDSLVVCVEICVRTGIYYFGELTPEDFLNIGVIPSHKEGGMELYVSLEICNDGAFLRASVENNLGHYDGVYALNDAEIESLHKLIIEQAHENPEFARFLGRAYLNKLEESSKYPEYRIYDDSHKFPHGLALEEFADSAHVDSRNYVLIDLDRPEDYLPIGFPYDLKGIHCSFKTIEELFAFYGDRDKLSFSDELAFIADCFDTYEYTGFSDVFSSLDEKASMYNGMRFTVERRLGYVTDNKTISNLPKWLITFENGDSFEAFPDEICKVEIERRKKERSNQAKSGIDYNKE